MSHWNSQFFEKLYSKLSASFIEDTQSLLAIGNPGTLISPELNPGSDMNAALLLSDLFDKIPQFNWVLTTWDTRIPDIYSSILRFKETPLNTGTSDRLKDARLQYEKDKADYLKWKYNYLPVQDEYLIAAATEKNRGARVPAALKQKRDKAYQQWQVDGHKARVEENMKIIAELLPLDSVNFWNEVQEQLNKGTRTTQKGREFKLTDFVPAYPRWFNDDGWKNFSFDMRDMDNQSNNDFLGFAGVLDYSFGLFNISGSGDYQSEHEYIELQQTDLSINCQLTRVSINRDWMNPIVLSSKAWRFSNDTPVDDRVICTGADLSSYMRPSGSMTVIPTAAILCKNLRVNGRLDDEATKNVGYAIKAGMSAAFGPFAIAGKFHGTNQAVQGSIANNVIEMREVQVIGLICEMLHQIPNPDPSLHW